VALLWAAKSLKTKGDNEDQDAGVNIVRRALQSPIRQIAENAGVEGSIVVGKITDQKAASYGYDAQNNEYGDLIAKGIIDPAKVVRTALQDAASASSSPPRPAWPRRRRRRPKAIRTACRAAAWAAWT
jgi:chaperonin GroEL